MEVHVSGSTTAATSHHLQWPRPAAATHRHRGRIRRGRCALQGVEPTVGLHPSIGVHAPLTFDIVDTWMPSALWAAASTTSRTPVAATTTPSRSTPTRPRAAACRASSSMGHTPGKHECGTCRCRPSREFPFTLDLRQCDRVARRPGRQPTHWKTSAPSLFAAQFFDDNTAAITSCRQPRRPFRCILVSQRERISTAPLCHCAPAPTRFPLALDMALESADPATWTKLQSWMATDTPSPAAPTGPLFQHIGSRRISTS